MAPGPIDTENYMRPIDVPLVRGIWLPSGRALDSGEMGQLFAVYAKDGSPAGKRDGTAFSLLYGGGRRRSRCNSRTTAETTAHCRSAATEIGSA